MLGKFKEIIRNLHKTIRNKYIDIYNSVVDDNIVIIVWGICIFLSLIFGLGVCEYIAQDPKLMAYFERPTSPAFRLMMKIPMLIFSIIFAIFVIIYYVIKKRKNNNNKNGKKNKKK